MEMVKNLGVDIGNIHSQNEYAPIVSVNKHIVQDLFGYQAPYGYTPRLPDNLKHYLRNPPLPVWDAAQRALKDAPEVIKDGRWGLTLPIWVEAAACAGLVPDHIVHLDRDSRQVAASRMDHNRSRPSFATDLPIQREIVNKQKNIIKGAVISSSALGSKIHNLVFPFHKRSLENVFHELWPDLSVDKIRQVIESTYDETKIRRTP